MRDHLKELAAAVIVAASQALSVQADNLVQNGDFDDNADGWKLIDHDNACANWYCVDVCNTGLAGGWDGECGWFYVNGNPDIKPETSQLVTGLTPQQEYRVSGYFVRVSKNDPDPLIRVLIDDEIYLEAEGDWLVWTEFSFTFVAQDADALLRFQSQINGDDAYGIDHISMTAVETCYADCNHDGQLDIFDFLCFFNAFESGCP